MGDHNVLRPEPGLTCRRRHQDSKSLISYHYLVLPSPLPLCLHHRNSSLRKRTPHRYKKDGQRCRKYSWLPHRIVKLHLKPSVSPVPFDKRVKHPYSKVPLYGFPQTSISFRVSTSIPSMYWNYRLQRWSSWFPPSCTLQSAVLCTRSSFVSPMLISCLFTRLALPDVLLAQSWECARWLFPDILLAMGSYTDYRNHLIGEWLFHILIGTVGFYILNCILGRQTLASVTNHSQ